MASKTDGMKGAVLIEREDSSNLAVVYPTTARAIHALDHSHLIDGLCQEDCIDCVMIDLPEGESSVPDGFEIIYP